MHEVAESAGRRIWEFIPDEWYREGVELAEKYADGLVNAFELQRAPVGSVAAHDAGPGFKGQAAAGFAADKDAFTAATEASYYAAWVASDPSTALAAHSYFSPTPAAEVTAAKSAEQAAQCSLLRDLFFNPFRPLPSIDQSWLLWNSGTIPRLAQATWHERRFGDLPILADALEEAGCDNADILAHCRQPGEHVRGCWVIDLLLGKS
jgi:hypothetical protein